MHLKINTLHSKVRFLTLFQIGGENLFIALFCFRWAQFFIHPLMIQDAIDREVEAVDSGKNSESFCFL